MDKTKREEMRAWRQGLARDLMAHNGVRKTRGLARTIRVAVRSARAAKSKRVPRN